MSLLSLAIGLILRLKLDKRDDLERPNLFSRSGLVRLSLLRLIYRLRMSLD